MPIWVWPMTEGLPRKRGTLRVHNLYTTCAPVWCIALALGAGAAQAETAWETFVDRCLDPFEHQTEPVVSGLNAQPIDQMHEAQRTYGPDNHGHLLVIDAAPREGDRSCSVFKLGGTAVEPTFSDWAMQSVDQGRYVRGSDRFASNEWIEPQLHLMAKIRPEGVQYTVLETDLES